MKGTGVSISPPRVLKKIFSVSFFSVGTTEPDLFEIREIPWNIEAVPKVTMMSGSLIITVSTPLIAPINPPAHIPKIIPSHTGTPAIMESPATTAERFKIQPNERSISPIESKYTMHPARRAEME